MKEYDVIKAVRKLSDKVDVGYEGTIVMIFKEPSSAYLVEFFDVNGDTADVIPVKPEDVILVTSV